LRRDEHGYWSARFRDVGPGALYRYRLNGSDDRVYPDPASRFQPHGVHGPSQVIDPRAFRWSDEEWRAPALSELIFYELHVGTFTPEGTYRAAEGRLPYLAGLGVTAVELMPLGDFPGRWNWGYDGAAIFAPARCYGSPDDLRALVERAHRLGLAVFVDVVYNHFGPDGAYANAFSAHYFTDAHRSPWGRGVNLDRLHSSAVRQFFIENAAHWVVEYHVDGLRLDATHALQDDSARHFLAELTQTIRAHVQRPVLFVAEDHRNLSQMLRPIEAAGYGIDAAWADDFHHQARVHTAGDREGYYADFSGSSVDIATTLRQGWFFTGQFSQFLEEPRGTDPRALSPSQFVICIQNHDQIGNRATGARLNHEIDPAAYRALSVLLLLAPQTPLLFMGQEWAASSPFLYFTDHHAELGRLVTEGRREEFKSFSAFRDPARRALIPDPQAEQTFERSRLRWEERSHAACAPVLRLYERLLALRRTHPALRQPARESYDVWAIDDHTIGLERRHGQEALVAVVRLSAAGVVSLPLDTPDIVLTSEDPDVAGDPKPIGVGGQPSGDSLQLTTGGPDVTFTFSRPGALVLRGRLRRGAGHD
jgi:maltooligosyltrehalose trehalohydrolase